MSHFTSSTKILLSFSETDSTKRVVAKYGDRLSGLSQSQKYSLVAAIATYLWGISEDIELKTRNFTHNENLVSTSRFAISPDLPKDVRDCLFILKNEDPHNLATILSAISDYAKEDDRLRR